MCYIRNSYVGHKKRITLTHYGMLLKLKLIQEEIVSKFSDKDNQEKL